MRPCLDCGEPSEQSRCPQHQHRPADTKPTAATRGYDNAWTRLSKRARRLQPWCETCGSTEDLQADHTPEAWARKTAGKAVRLKDVRVLWRTMQPHRRCRTRPYSDQGGCPSGAGPRPPG